MGRFSRRPADEPYGSGKWLLSGPDPLSMSTYAALIGRGEDSMPRGRTDRDVPSDARGYSKLRTRDQPVG
jgi:hypothetical protein